MNIQSNGSNNIQNNNRTKIRKSGGETETKKKALSVKCSRSSNQAISFYLYNRTKNILFMKDKCTQNKLIKSISN